jgi:hypothetical protein
MSINEILQELPNLNPEERQALRDWLDSADVPETDELIAAVDEGFRSSQTGKGISIEEQESSSENTLHGPPKRSSG